MRITTLAEDSPGKAGTKSEHGLSFFVETAKHTLLVDTGASGLTFENADFLGADIASVDTVIISHGHYDHAGGLMCFSERNPHAEIYMHALASGDYYHGEKYIGIDKQVLSLPMMTLVRGNLKIDDELFLFSGIEKRREGVLTDNGLSQMVNGRLIPDEFLHEQSLVIIENGKKILLSGCAHNGILNILDGFFEIFGCYPDEVFSGFHMMKKTDYSEAEICRIKKTAEKMLKTGSVFHSGHCTGDTAFDMMKEIMGDKLEKIYPGSINEI